LLAQYFYGGGVVNGEPDFTVTTDADGPDPYSFEELEELMEEIDGSLHPDVPKYINEFMKIGQSIYNLKSKIPDNRFEEIYGISKQYKKILDLHEKIRKIQKDYRNILDRIIEGAPLNEIPTLAEKFKTIYDVSKMKTTKLIAGRDSFEKIPLIDETNYIRNKINRNWFIELQDEFVYWMIEFLKEEHNRKYIKNCPYCEKFFPAKDIRRKSRCYSGKCEKAYQRDKKRKQRENDPVKYV
jgi:hypothetical protein